MLPSIMLLRGFVAGEAVSGEVNVPVLLVRASVRPAVGDLVGEAVQGSPEGSSLTPPPMALAAAAPWWKRTMLAVVAFVTPKRWRA